MKCADSGETTQGQVMSAAFPSATVSQTESPILAVRSGKNHGRCSTQNPELNVSEKTTGYRLLPPGGFRVVDAVIVAVAVGQDQLILSSSTSKFSVAFGPILLPAPCSP